MKHRTFTIQRPTFIRGDDANSLGIGYSMLNVECFFIR
jgi:hypothetical protein